VPAGRYARGALEAAGLWTAVEPRTISAQNVRQALDYVAREEVDAGFVYASDAALMPGKVKVAFTVATVTPIRYPVAVLGTRESVRQLVEGLEARPETGLRPAAIFLADDDEQYKLPPTLGHLAFWCRDSSANRIARLDN